MNVEVNPWCFVLHVNPETDLDEAWRMLQDIGLQPLYMEEDPEQLSKIYVTANSDHTLENLLERFAFIEYIDQEELGTIDWQAQWQAHGFNFYDGHVHIELPHAVSPSWQQIKLQPGAGFGDLSHPTTRLILNMMHTHVSEQDVIDIGCGSGVLALCAIGLGAKHVYAIDIDAQALKHAHENALLNAMENKISFSLPTDFHLPSVVESSLLLINMTLAEQQEAWNALESLHHQQGICIASGILIEQKQAYLKLTQEWGWEIDEEQEANGWLGFKFVKASSSKGQNGRNGHMD